MPEVISSVMDFTRMFPDEPACWKYLNEIRWPKGFVCPICGEKARAFDRTYNRWICKKDHRVSVTAGTIMHGTKLPLMAWFWAAFMTATEKTGISAVQLSKRLGVTRETAYMMLHKLRAGSVNPDRMQLRGTVQVDETTVGGEGKGGRGRSYSPEKSIVIGAVEVRVNKKGKEYSGRLRLRQIDTWESKDFHSFIQDHIEAGATVITDGFKAYLGLCELGYRHIVCGGEDSIEVAQKMSCIHIAFSNLKAFLVGTYHGVSKKHLQAYLNEYVFRFNRRYFDLDIFNMILGIGMEIRSPRYEDIYEAGGKWKHISGLLNRRKDYV